MPHVVREACCCNHLQTLPRIFVLSSLRTCREATCFATRLQAWCHVQTMYGLESLAMLLWVCMGIGRSPTKGMLVYFPSSGVLGGLPILIHTHMSGTNGTYLRTRVFFRTRDVCTVSRPGALKEPDTNKVLDLSKVETKLLFFASKATKPSAEEFSSTKEPNRLAV